ncbi:MAG: T9SS C-terminal target domain-containing protein [Pirellulaceae bacterium]|nr:T9SS C-terminal target domain-containing protein [Pirellulaceae bacterium]
MKQHVSKTRVDQAGTSLGLRLGRCFLAVLVWCGWWFGLPNENAFSQTLIDINPDNGRSDVRTPDAINWPIGSTKSAQVSADALGVELRTVTKGSRLKFDWWKAGYDVGATLASDGVTTEQPGETIELILSGLAPGKHTLLTWHNHTAAVSAPHRVGIQVGNGPEVVVNATSRVTHDDDAATGYVVFEAVADRETIVRIRPLDINQSAILNGLQLDVTDASRQARKPSPAHADEHVATRPILAWQPPRTSDAAKLHYRVYAATDRARVARAQPGDVCQLGTTSDLKFAFTADDCLEDYYWRVDVVDGDSTIQGQVWRFKIAELAFPTAEGYGRFAIGGRGGRVIEVTHLEDSGPGSLRAAVEAEGPRTVIFKTGGTIRLKSKLIIHNPYITIAGHTAPGDGICVRGYTFGCMGAHDVIMRHVRIRVGDESGQTMDGTGFASTDHAIFDHCSISWSIDEAVSSRSAKNITFQRSIVAEALNIANHRKYEAGKGHSFAGSISGDVGSFHHNLLAHCAGRNWSLAGGLTRGGNFAGRLDIRNNVVFNWQHRTNDGGVKTLNLVNNLYLPGPATRVFHLLKPDVGQAHDRQQYFVTGNRMEGRYTEDGDNWSDGVVLAAEFVEAVKLTEPFCEPHVTTDSVANLLDNVLSDVGANHAGWDAVDQRVVTDVRARQTSATGSRSGLPGIIDSQSDVGGWPELQPGIAPPDSDHDGLPDAWELAHNLNPHVPSHNARMPGSRVTALEVYLAQLAARPKMPKSHPRP